MKRRRQRTSPGFRRNKRRWMVIAWAELRNELSDKERAVLEGYIQGRKQADTAAILGCTRQNVSLIESKVMWRGFAAWTRILHAQREKMGLGGKAG